MSPVLPESSRRIVVGEGGFEPPHPFGHWLLKPACLPFHHSPVGAASIAGVRPRLAGGWRTQYGHNPSL